MSLKSAFTRIWQPTLKRTNVPGFVKTAFVAVEVKDALDERVDSGLLPRVGVTVTVATLAIAGELLQKTNSVDSHKLSRKKGLTRYCSSLIGKVQLPLQLQFQSPRVQL